MAAAGVSYLPCFLIEGKTSEQTQSVNSSACVAFERNMNLYRPGSLMYMAILSLWLGRGVSPLLDDSIRDSSVFLIFQVHGLVGVECH